MNWDSIIPALPALVIALVSAYVVSRTQIRQLQKDTMETLEVALNEARHEAQQQKEQFEREKAEHQRERASDHERIAQLEEQLEEERALRQQAEDRIKALEPKVEALRQVTQAHESGEESPPLKVLEEKLAE